MKFGEYLRQRREDAKLTQPEAAAKAGIEQSYLSKLETGKSHPSDEVFSKLVEAYDIDVDQMIMSVDSVELRKLHEVAAVRSAVIAADERSRISPRRWLVAAVLLFSLGGGITTFGATLKISPKTCQYIQLPRCY